MKRETFRHPKLYDLASHLGCSRPTALGHLALLWDFTAELAPDGSVGRFPDGSIEGSVDWTGEPGKFVSSAVQTRWIDIHPTFRLVIHDWADHCERWVRAKLQRLGIPIIECSTEGSTERSTVSDSSARPIQSNPIQSPVSGLEGGGVCTFQEFSDYCRQLGFGESAHNWWEYQNRVGWQAARDWQAAIRARIKIEGRPPPSPLEKQGPDRALLHMDQVEREFRENGPALDLKADFLDRQKKSRTTRPANP